jgi:tetratricopeptide (TPR) repeat protein
MIGTRSLLCLLVLSALQPPWAFGQDAPAPTSKRYGLFKLGGSYEAYTTQKIAQQYKGNYEKAIKELSETIRLNPKQARNYNNRGLGYHGRGDYENAIKDFSEAIRLDPEYVAAYTNRGNAYAAQKEHEKAIKDHSKAISLDCTCDVAKGNLARVYLKNKQYDRAIEEYTPAIDFNSLLGLPSIPSLLLERGIAYSAKRDSDNAIRDFSEAISIHITSGKTFGYTCPQAYFYRGIAYFCRKKYHLGFEDLKEYWRSITGKASEGSDEHFDFEKRFQELSVAIDP